MKRRSRLQLMLLIALLPYGCGEPQSPSYPARYSYLNDGAVASEHADRFRVALPFDSISLERYECLGECPVYSVIFRRGGRATFVGLEHVEMMGIWTTEISLYDMGRIAHLIERLEVEQMDTLYAKDLTDVAGSSLRIWRQGSFPKVIRDEGDVGPTELWAVMTAIDAITYNHRWKHLE